MTLKWRCDVTIAIPAPMVSSLIFIKKYRKLTKDHFHRREIKVVLEFIKDHSLKMANRRIL